MKSLKKYFFVWLILAILVIPISVFAENEILIDKIEMTVDYSIKVGEAPVYKATLKNNESIENFMDMIRIKETYYARVNSSITSYLTSILDEGFGPEDSTNVIKDYVYEYVLNIDIKPEYYNNYMFDETTKLYINGKEVPRRDTDSAYSFSQTESWLIFTDYTTPEGYSKNPDLEYEDEMEQIEKINDELLELIKENKVTFSNDDYKTIIDEALADTNKEVSIETWVEGYTLNNIFGHGTDEDAQAQIILDKINAKLNENQKLAAIYNVYLTARIDMDNEFYDIVSIETPIKFVVAKPTYLPEVKEGYKRVFKFLRFHDDEIDVIDATEKDHLIETESDKFSIYALYYEDIEDPDYVPKKETNNPKTSDNVIIYLIILLGSTYLLTKKKANI